MISSSDFDYYNPVILEGPEVECWQTFCKLLMDSAATLALHDAQRDDLAVSWSLVFDRLLSMLKEKGYRVIRPEEFMLTGGRVENDELNELNREIRKRLTIYNLQRDVRITRRLFDHGTKDVVNGSS